MLRISLLLAGAQALQAPPRQRRATHLRAAEAALAVDAADAFDQFGVAAVAASAKLASQDPAGEKPSDAQTRGVVLATAAAGAVAVLAAAPKTARASIAEPVQPAVASGIPNKLARQLLQIERLNVDSNGSGDRRTHKPRLDISGNSAKVCIDGYEPEGSDRVQFIWLKNEEADAIVAAKVLCCVEIKPSARRRPRDASAHGITHRLISTQEFPEGFKGTPMLSCSVTPGRTYAPCAYFTTHGLWLGRSETA